MKLWSKEALVLGGGFGVLDTLASLLGVETVSEILFMVFFGCVIMLCFNKTPKFLQQLITGYPVTSYYLAAIGWVPYFMIVTFMIIAGIFFSVGFDNALFIKLIYTIAVLGLIGAVVSLVAACIKAKTKKA